MTIRSVWLPTIYKLFAWLLHLRQVRTAECLMQQEWPNCYFCLLCLRNLYNGPSLSSMHGHLGYLGVRHVVGDMGIRLHCTVCLATEFQYGLSHYLWLGSLVVHPQQFEREIFNPTLIQKKHNRVFDANVKTELNHIRVGCGATNFEITLIFKYALNLATQTREFHSAYNSYQWINKCNSIYV